MKRITLGLLLLATAPAWSQDRFDAAPLPARPAAASPAAPAGPAAPRAPANAPAPATPRAAPADADRLARIEAIEREESGARASAELHTGPMHGPTPASIPGAKLVSTRELAALLEGGSSRALVFDVLGGNERLPNALNALPAHQAGSFDDETQRQFGAFLKQVTQGRTDVPLVFYCGGMQCWMSYNAALRASRLGYRQVLWYRGGVEAWKAAGLPVQGAGGTAR
jgi:rhodanese-related sulfurtransferase